MTRRVTSLDIARHIGVSRSTVSFVINGRMDLPVAAKTRERVLRAARELNYVPNAAARGLVTGRTQTIGVSAGHPTDPHYAGLLDDLLSGAREQGYRLLVVSEEDDSTPFLLSEGRLDGLIAIGGGSILNASPEGLAPRIPHIVVHGSGGAPTSPHRIEWDDIEGARLMGQHLLALGHQKIVMFAGVAGAENLKVQGFVKAMRPVTKTPLLLHCEDEKDPYRAGQQMFDDLRRHYPDVSAVFCRNDVLAMGALSRAAELNLNIPQDLSIAGYSNMPMAAYTVPSLTTVATPIREAGRQAIEMLLQVLKGESVEPQQIDLPVRLIERGSTGPFQESRKTRKAGTRRSRQ